MTIASYNENSVMPRKPHLLKLTNVGLGAV
jgi:hypothetical protein